ncbi:MAG: endonuclease [Gammaproteobacteria bacterium]|nr:endonuclease [Gammaproteobacteria bacterium]
MKLRKLFILVLSIFVSLTLVSCTKKTKAETTTTNPKIEFVYYTPETSDYYLKKMKKYYESSENFSLEFTKDLSGETLILYLKSFLSVVHCTKAVGYGNLRQHLLTTDASLTNSTKLTLFYSRDEIDAKWDSGKTWNREHVYCRNLAGFEKDYNNSKQFIVYDLHHVRPADSSVNSSRSDSPYGEVANKDTARKIYTKNGTLAGYLQNDIFEPIDSVKGDVARIVMYVSVVYYMMYDKTVELGDVISSESLALKWNAMDPVDDSELYRNNAAFGIQGNRNIFIDFPEIANQIWG